jgi:hypothetical protein
VHPLGHADARDGAGHRQQDTGERVVSVCRAKRGDSGRREKDTWRESR